MKFYSDTEANEIVMIGKRAVSFAGGQYETDDAEEIAVFKKYYRSDDDGRSPEQGDEEGQEIKEEPSFADLRRQAKEAGIEGYGKMKKAELLEALEEGV